MERHSIAIYLTLNTITYHYYLSQILLLTISRTIVCYNATVIRTTAEDNPSINVAGRKLCCLDPVFSTDVQRTSYWLSFYYTLADAV